jgi:hypothetical protein
MPQDLGVLRKFQSAMCRTEVAPLTHLFQLRKNASDITYAVI